VCERNVRGQFSRSVVALLCLAVAAVLSGCGQGATAKAEVPLRSGPESGQKIVAVVPAGSAVKVSKCARGWCQVTWRGQSGYALAKDFRVAGMEDSAEDTETDPGDEDADE
jgi:uncharacterized protein YraI